MASETTAGNSQSIVKRSINTKAQTSRSAGSAALSVGEISVSSSIDDGSLTPTFMSKHEEEEEEPLVKLKRKYIESNSLREQSLMGIGKISLDTKRFITPEYNVLHVYKIARIHQRLEAEQFSNPADFMAAFSGINVPKRHKGDAAKVLGPTGPLLLHQRQDTSLRLLEVSVDREMSKLCGHTDWVNGVDFSLCGEFAVSASDDCTVKHWECITGECLRTYRGHTRGVRGVAYYSAPSKPSQQLFLSASVDRTLRLWNPLHARSLSLRTKDQSVVVLEGHKAAVNDCCFFGSGVGAAHPVDAAMALAKAKAARAEADKAAKAVAKAMKRVEEEEKAVEIEEENADEITALEKIAASLDEEPSTETKLSLANDAADKAKAMAEQLAEAADAAMASVTKMTASSDASYRENIPARALSCSDDETVKLWDVAAGRCVWSSGEHHRSVLTVVAATPNVALTMDESWVLRQWDVRAGKCVWRLPDQAPWLKLIRI